MTLDVITRPNGKPYRPRKVIAYGVYDPDECPESVVVLGTHDVVRAQALATTFVKHDLLDSSYAPAGPCTVWWRDGMEYGRRVWLNDAEHGRAGVWFRELVEDPRA